MKNKKGLVISFLLVFFIFGVTIPLFMTNHKKVKADTLSDLTGTTWIFNTLGGNNIDSLSAKSISGVVVDTMVDLPNFSGIRVNSYDNIQFYADFYMGGENNWTTASSYFSTPLTINITGGSDKNNSELITWLQNNATQQATGTQISHLYWAIATGFRMSENELYSDNDIEYTVLFNEQRREYDETVQTGLVFKGPTSEDDTCYMWAINGTGINLLYRSEDDRFFNATWLEFTPGDYIDTDLYNFMDLVGYWFDDAEAYLCGTNQGYAEGKEIGRALGQADGVEYTGLVTGIFNGLGGLLNIQVFPNITIGLLIGLPLLLGALIIILKILRG